MVVKTMLGIRQERPDKARFEKLTQCKTQWIKSKACAVVYQELAAENQYEHAPLTGATAPIVDKGALLAMSHNVCLCKQLWPAGLTNSLQFAYKKRCRQIMWKSIVFRIVIFSYFS